MRLCSEVLCIFTLQIRSHAQKYFQKLIKNGQQHEVPDARAKRPVSLAGL